MQTDSAAFLTQQIAKIDGSRKTYWRVKANVANANSNWSETRWFEGSLFSVTSPEDGQGDVSVTPTITWNNAGEGTTYLCEVATSNTFYSTEMVFSTTTTETSVQIPANILAYNRNYYVRVAAKSPIVNAISATTLFTTEKYVMQPPVVVSPTDGEEVKAPTLRIVVGEIPNNGFRFEVSKVESFPGRATKVKVAELGEYSVEYDNLEDGEYYIRVATLEEATVYTDFSTPIKIQYTKTEGVSVENTELKNIHIVDNLLYAPADEHYTIYTITGSVVARGITTETTQLPNLANGIYIIEVGNTAIKYVVKH